MRVIWALAGIDESPVRTAPTFRPAVDDNVTVPIDPFCATAMTLSNDSVIVPAEIASSVACCTALLSVMVLPLIATMVVPDGMPTPLTPWPTERPVTEPRFITAWPLFDTTDCSVAVNPTALAMLLFSVTVPSEFTAVIQVPAGIPVPVTDIPTDRPATAFGLIVLPLTVWNLDTSNELMSTTLSATVAICSWVGSTAAESVIDVT